ncbi:UvrD-helicase domain-containing protein [Legionella lytica]|uniref:UvrD-helicase domain-containing protein n=1 Tax=Legionella lytica TaxID=96232 RepID=A0ABW8D919_9GAMM
MSQYSFILPKNLQAFIRSVSSDQQQAVLITKRLEAVITEGEKSIKKKAQGSQIFYTFNIDIGKHAHRAIFEQVSFNGSSFFLLRSIAWMHNYEPALRWGALNQVTEESLNNLYEEYEGYQTIERSSELTEPKDEAIEDKGAIYYRGRSLVPTSLQAKILRPTPSSPLSMPLILVGPPGSGKTLIGMSLLQERAMAHCNNEDPNVLELCYVAESRALVDQHKENWMDFSGRYLTKQANEIIKVHFHTVEEYAQQYAKSLNYEFLAGSAAQKLLEKHLGKDIKEHQELYHNAWRIYLDSQNGMTPYNESLYKETGASNSFYSLEERAQRYAKYVGLMNELEQKKLFFFGVSPMQAGDSGHKDKFHLTIIDEAQRINPALLQGFMQATENRNVLVIGDPYQKGGSPFSSLDALRALTHHCFKLELSYSQLPSSLRVQADVAEVLDNVVLLYTHLLGGKVDAISYSSLRHENHSAQDTTARVHVHLLQNPLPAISQKQITALGANAHAAALVLNPTDKERAGALINSSNVFTAKEVLGLEFSQILLYLSENTLKQFIDISILMDEQGIKPGQALSALNNKPAEKGSNKGQMQELLSDLLVALSRTQGALYVVCESPEKAHKLKPFLKWFKTCLGGERADVQIEVVHNSDEDWLHAINNFIQANALIPAKENLQTKFKLTEAQANAYVALCQQNKMMSTPEELDHWLNPIPSPDDSRAEEPETVLLESSNIDVTQWEDLHVRLLHEGANAIEFFLMHEQASELLFKRAMITTPCLWINLTLNHFDVLSPVFAQPNHHYEMLLKEGFQYAKATNNHLLLLCLALVAPRHAFAVEAKQYLGDELMQGSSQFQAQLVRLFLKSNYLNSFTKDDFFNTKTTGSPQLAHVLLSEQTDDLCTKYPNLKLAVVSAINAGNGGFVSAPGIYQGHNLITCLLDSKFDHKFFEDKKTRELILKKWGQLFGKACPGALHRLCQQEKGVELLNKYGVQNNESYFNTFFSPIENDLSQGASPFHFLCERDSGVAFLNKNRAGFAKALNKANVLFTPVTDEGTEKGVTPFHRLCSSQEGIVLLKSFGSLLTAQLKSNPGLLFIPVGEGTSQGATVFSQLCGRIEGRVLLKEHWSDFASYLRRNPEVLFAPVTGVGTLKEDTAFYLLFCRVEGKSLSKEHWLDFLPYLSKHPELLFVPLISDSPAKRDTPFFQLCDNTQGRLLLKRYWANFASYIRNHPELLFTRVNENSMTSFAQLCCSTDGRALLNEYWSDFASHLRSHPELLFTPVTGEHSYKGETAFLRLCSADGIAYLSEHWSDFASYLRSHPGMLFVPITSEGSSQGVTPFFQLCYSTAGKALLKEHWSDFAPHLRSHPDLLFAPLTGSGVLKGYTPFYQLCREAEGIVLLKEHWSDFVSHLKDRPDLLFVPVTGNGPYKGETAFSRLCVSRNGITLLNEHWSDFASHLRNHPELLFAPVTGEGPFKGETPFCLLCGSVEGIVFLKEHWSYFASHLRNDPGLLFALVTGNGSGKGTMPFSGLSRCEEGKRLVDLFFNELDESKKTMLLGFINVLLNNEYIAEEDKVELRELQQRTTQQSNGLRFFPRAQRGNDESDSVEKKPSDIGPR